MRNSPKRFAAACAAISLFAAARPAAAASPAIALLDAAEAPQWKTWLGTAGWQLVVPATSANSADTRVQAIAAAVRQAISAGTVDPARVYIAGHGETAPYVFYAISRIPDLWAAGIALGGSPQPAIDTGRIFAANFTNSPVLWVSAGANDSALAAKLKQAGMNVEWRSAEGLANSAVFEWLAQHKREPFPPEVDCETNSPTFASCYWLQPSKFDVGERNDVLPPTRVVATSIPVLDLGAFAYKADDPGPGIQVTYLPEKYNGPLKVGDRIVEIEGKPVVNARQYREMMARYSEEKPVIVMVQRGRSREHMETRVITQRIDSSPTARVQGKYAVEDNLVLVISRGITEMRVTIPEQWVGAGLNWDGLPLEKIEKPGCLLLTIDKELLHAADCK